ncbi:MAG: gliding motility-associated C-terminal domain-containing protein, partial [Candidatus Latescibacterota bacterium]
NVPECSQCTLTSLTDFYLFGRGYVAEAVMESEFIDLGGTKSIRRLSWDADLPPGTFVEIRSQTGDNFVFEQKFYNKNGVEISEAQWNKLPKSQKLDVVEIQRRGSDWSGWSAVYSGRDEVFLSPSPRRFAQLQVRLGNDDPEVAPLLRNIVLHFDDALISGGVLSRILPREAAFDSLQTFAYVIKPSFRFGDRGFDRVSIQVPAPVSGVKVRIGGDPVVPIAVEMISDSLRIDLPERIQRDSVEVLFQTRIQQNATVFDGWVSVDGDPLQQGLRPEDQHATTVFVPSVAGVGGLIRSVDVTSVVTPNGDGINDEASIRFSLAKVEMTPPVVTLHDMTGRLVGEATARGDEFVWDGRDESGQLLPPGAYLCRISVPADIGERAVHRIIILAY